MKPVFGRVARRFLMGAAALLTASQVQAATERTIHDFDCNSDGCGPGTGLTWDGTQTHLYGTTNSNGPGSDGTVFEMTPARNGNWKYKVIYSLTPNGGYSFTSSLTWYRNALYGATTSHGDPKCLCGTVFELKKIKGVWTETVLHSFTGGTTDGMQGNGGVAFDSNGNLFGTTEYGGTGTCSPYQCGTVYELSRKRGTWNFQIIYSFGTSISYPFATPAIDPSGNIWVTACCGSTGYGGAIELTPSGAGWSVQNAIAFTGLGEQNPGSQPIAGVIFDSQGNVYGTTQQYWIVYQLMASQGYAENALLSDANQTSPHSPLEWDDAGNLYGTSWSSCGNNSTGYGCVFELSPNGQGGWNSNVLHVFSGGTNGVNLPGSVVTDRNGNVFGTTLQGGAKGGGVVFEISP